MKTALLLLTCVPMLACVSSERGFAARDVQSQIVTIGAGRAIVSDDPSIYWRLWYIIDPYTRTCWFKIGDSVGELDCCRLRQGVKRAVVVINWLNQSDCAYFGQGGTYPYRHATKTSPAPPHVDKPPVVKPPDSKSDGSVKRLPTREPPPILVPGSK